MTLKNIHLFVRTSLLLCIVTFTGCASVDARKPFADVRKEAKQKTGGNVHWKRGMEEEDKIQENVRELLASTVSREEAVQVALLNNPRLQGTYEELGIAQADLVRAGLLSNPVFEGEMIFSGGERISTGIEVLENFIEILMIPLRKKLAGAHLEEAKLRVVGKIMDLSRRISIQYYRLQAAHREHVMFQNTLETTEASLDMAKKLREAGNITQLEVLQERALHEKTKLNLARSEMKIARLRESLHSLMGLWGTRTTWKSPAELPAVPDNGISIEHPEKRAISGSIDLGIQRKKVEAMAHRVGITNVTSVFPFFDLGFAAEEEGDGDWNLGPKLEFPLPLFNQGQPARAAAHARLQKEWQHYAATAIEIRSAVRSARDQLQLARRRAVYYRDVLVPLQKRILNRGILRFNGMFIGVFQLLTFKQKEISVRRNYINALKKYWIARTNYSQILNGRLVRSTGMDSMNGMSSGPAGMQSDGNGH